MRDLVWKKRKSGKIAHEMWASFSFFLSACLVTSLHFTSLFLFHCCCCCVYFCQQRNLNFICIYTHDWTSAWKWVHIPRTRYSLRTWNPEPKAEAQDIPVNFSSVNTSHLRNANEILFGIYSNFHSFSTWCKNDKRSHRTLVHHILIELSSNANKLDIIGRSFFLYLFPSWDFSECDKKRKRKMQNFLLQLLVSNGFDTCELFRNSKISSSSSIRHCSIHAFDFNLSMYPVCVRRLPNSAFRMNRKLNSTAVVSTPRDRDSSRVWQCWEKKVSKTASSPGTLTLCVGKWLIHSTPYRQQRAEMWRKYLQHLTDQIGKKWELEVSISTSLSLLCLCVYLYRSCLSHIED